MTNQNNDYVLELVEKHGGSVVNGGRMVIFGRDGSFHSFVAGLREKDAKLIAGLVDAIKRYGTHPVECYSFSADPSLNNCKCRLKEIISAAQPTANAFMAEHDARVLEEVKKQFPITSSDDDNWYGVYAIHGRLQLLIDEKRKSVKPEGEGK